MTLELKLNYLLKRRFTFPSTFWNNIVRNYFEGFSELECIKMQAFS
jgi:hypothetical protein